MCEDLRKVGDAQWVMDETLQAHNEAAEEEFSHIGLTTMLRQPCVVKLMLNGAMANQEVVVQKWFTLHPHTNIVQGICNFTCDDNPLRWVSKLTRPQVFCNGDVSSMFIVIIQEYVERGSLTMIGESDWTGQLWTSIVLQLTYACMEWYEQGFLFGDWHFGNILLDTTNSKIHEYNALGTVFRIKTNGVSPVLTDFARSTLRPPKSLEIWTLSNQLSMIWDIFKSSCPFDKNTIRDFAIAIGQVETRADIIAHVKRFRNFARI